ncbi:MAG: hypothetical protein RDU20_12810 [Desulfomonilaceae bacterium]|nr:hypothetical protein [Desulfomonilaceae bacterium]
MPESKGKVSTKEILADIRAGMDESELMAKYRLSPQNLQTVFRKLAQAGYLDPSHAGSSIPADHALVPVEKKARDVPRDSRERKIQLRRLREQRKAREESERLLMLMESTSHRWLVGLGVVALFAGTVLYLMWPYIDSLWFGDLALDRALGRHGSAQRSYEIWHRVSTAGGPVTALVGGVLVAVGLIKRWMNKRKLEKMIVRQRQALVFEPSRETSRS